MGTFWLEGMSGSLKWCSSTHTGSGLGWVCHVVLHCLWTFSGLPMVSQNFLQPQLLLMCPGPSPLAYIKCSYSFHIPHQTLNGRWLETLHLVDVFRVVYEVICAPPPISHLKVNSIYAVPQRVWLKCWSACKPYVCMGRLFSVPSLYYYAMVMCDAC